MANLFAANDIKNLANSLKLFVREQKKDLGNRIAPCFVGEKELSNILEVAFESTLQREEGRFHRFTIIAEASSAGKRRKRGSRVTRKPYLFSRNLDYTIRNIRLLSTALDGTSTEIFVRLDHESRPKIIGFGDDFEVEGWVIESLDMGKMRFSVRFVVASTTVEVQIAIIDGTRIRFFDDTGDSYRSVLTSVLCTSSLFDKFADAITATPEQDLIQDYFKLIEWMSRHRHGGCLLFVTDAKWKQCVQKPMILQCLPKYDEIKTWTSRRGEYWNFDGKDNIPIEYSVADVNAEEALKRLSQLTALDGATIITKDFEVLTFGANLKPVNAKRRPDLILCRSPFRNIPEKEVRFEEIGGTRHKSACQFVFDQRESVAIVASQDGHVSVIYWDDEIKKLRALQNAEYLA